MSALMTQQPTHTPVLLDEAIRFLAVREGGRYIDCTAGLGGHSEAIAEAVGPTGELLCIDRDADALAIARERLAKFGSRVTFAHGNFGDVGEIAGQRGMESVDGILMDLGVSSLQFGGSERGFAFSLEGPLDMRMDRRQSLTAADIVNTWAEEDLADLFRRYGEVSQARRIASHVVRSREIRTTWELARAVEQAAGGARGRSKTHPATKVFLALRVRVNDELDCLHEVLPLARSLLGFGSTSASRLVVISFHSLEDRIVKEFLRREATDCVCPPKTPVCICDHRASLTLLTRRGVRPSEHEVAMNPRARSATLRAAERVR